MKLITGGTSRLGQEIVRRLDGEVLVHYFHNEALAKELSPHIIQADLNNVEGFLSRLSKFDVIINNFALIHDPKWGVAEWERMYKINVALPMMLMQHIDKGVVINISSVAAEPGVFCDIGYGATKAALNKFTDTYKKPGVRINAIAPAEFGTYIRPEDIADEVIRVISDESIDGQIISMWGSYPARI